MVHVQPRGPVQVGYGLACHLARATLMAQEPADHRAVLLLHPGLIVLAVRPGTGELDAPVGACFVRRSPPIYDTTRTRWLLLSAT